jgi:hypothetical protein
MTVCLSQFAVFAGDVNQRFFRVEVTEYGNSVQGPTEVKLRLPMNMFRAFQGNFDNVVNETGFSDNYTMWRDAWKEVVALGPHDFVEIQEGDSFFKLSTTTTHLVIEAEDAEQTDTASIRIPLILGSVFFDADQFPTMDEVLHALAELPADSLMELSADNVDMRVWIE